MSEKYFSDRWKMKSSGQQQVDHNHAEMEHE